MADSPVCGSEQQKERRKKRWGAETEAGIKVLEQVADQSTVATERGESNQDEPTAKKRRSRWEDEAKPQSVSLLSGLSSIILPPALAALVDINPETIELQRLLNGINNKLQLLNSGVLVDDIPVGQRSPSPEPIYNEAGIRTNTREQRIKENLIKERTGLITEMIKKNPNYKPPSDYRPDRKYRRLRIPQEDFPGYNFIGLIIGPRGNTQKRMEKETGAKIAIRGKGSVKEGRSKKEGGRPDPSDEEELHVLITADTDDAADKAAAMVQKLLLPTDDTMNDHKKKQLMELASLNGTLRDHELLALQKSEQTGGEVYQLPDHLKERVDEQYRRDVAAVHGQEVAGRMESEYKSFIKELGGDVPRPELDMDLGGSSTGPRGGLPGPPPRHGLGFNRGRGRDDDEFDPKALYIGYLPPNYTEEEFGRLLTTICGEAAEDIRFIKDKFSGQSKGFGFVHMKTEAGATAAIQRLDNYQVGGRRLVVRYKGRNSTVQPTSTAVPLPGPPPLPDGSHPPSSDRERSTRPSGPPPELDICPPGSEGPTWTAMHRNDMQYEQFYAKALEHYQSGGLPLGMIQRLHHKQVDGSGASGALSSDQASTRDSSQAQIQAFQIEWMPPPPAEEPGPPGDEEFYFATKAEEMAAAWSAYYSGGVDMTLASAELYQGQGEPSSHYGHGASTGTDGAGLAAAPEPREKEPKVVQVLTLSNDEVERSKKQREEERKQQQLQKEEQRKEEQNRRRNAQQQEQVMSTARVTRESVQNQSKLSSQAPPPPPPPPPPPSQQPTRSRSPSPHGRSRSKRSRSPHRASRRETTSLSPSGHRKASRLTHTNGSKEEKRKGKRSGGGSPPPNKRRSPSPRKVQASGRKTGSGRHRSTSRSPPPLSDSRRRTGHSGRSLSPSGSRPSAHTNSSAVPKATPGLKISSKKADEVSEEGELSEEGEIGVVVPSSSRGNSRKDIKEDSRSHSSRRRDDRHHRGDDYPYSSRDRHYDRESSWGRDQGRRQGGSSHGRDYHDDPDPTGGFDFEAAGVIVGEDGFMYMAATMDNTYGVMVMEDVAAELDVT